MTTRHSTADTYSGGADVRIHLPYSSRTLNLPIAPLIYLKHIYAIQEKRAICTSSQAEQRLKVVMFIPNLDGKCD